MQNIRSSGRKKSLYKKRILSLIITCTIVIIALFINFFNGPKIEEYKSQNNQLKTELQKLKEQNANLSEKNSKLNKDYSDVKAKSEEMPKVSK
ncbi:hypothetical protein RBU49_07970 [Clostridium sp. MB40-C1]|uniref:hypothetical protein n=1 Tax=Clostridium sp. MB40-C1 TaxID=3070996 RepID=UPI0027DF0058|nr:hypothetical protein [Clostridium sp. MB40-C1]WMJ82177.1 hypothetical protein RBU49_07970 [Clostridium sp. MB40-C1]